MKYHCVICSSKSDLQECCECGNTWCKSCDDYAGIFDRTGVCFICRGDF
jgi:hypothetical protein